MLVKVIPKARKCSVERLPDGSLRVRVSSPAEAGQANAAVIEVLAKHFGVPKRSVTILQGATRRTKLVTVLR